MRARHAIICLAGIGAATLGIGLCNARSEPMVRRAAIALPGWPAGARPVRIALVSDLHLESLAMNRSRLLRIVDEVNALHPDIVLLAGDYVEGYSPAEAARIAPILTDATHAFVTPLGVVAVLGNHDHDSDPPEVEKALRDGGATVLRNDAVARGPLAIGGLDDAATDHDRMAPTLEKLRRVRGAKLIVTHSPTAITEMPGDVRLLLAGHTHCGQIMLPHIGAPIVVAGIRYNCGLVRDPGRVTIVTGGIGTSDAPIRYGTRPDIWLIRVGPNAAALVSPARS